MSRLGPLGLIALLGVIAAAILVATQGLVRPWVVVGRSMEPTLLQGDRVLVDSWTYRHRPPRVGEVVLHLAPDGSARVKRVARRPATPAGRPRPELWPQTERPRVWIWVVGDRRGMSGDSRRFGPVPDDAFRGRVVWRYWPVTRAGPLHPEP